MSNPFSEEEMKEVMGEPVFDFKGETDRMLLAARFLASVNLDKIIETISDAHSYGPILDPTKYRDALSRGDMDRVNRLAQALIEPRKIMREMLAAYGAMCASCGSTAVRFDPADGMCCSSCGRCDSDE